MSASWVIVSKVTGKAIMETFSKSTADAVRRDSYDAVPIMQYLQSLNTH